MEKALQRLLGFRGISARNNRGIRDANPVPPQNFFRSRFVKSKVTDFSAGAREADATLFEPTLNLAVFAACAVQSQNHHGLRRATIERAFAVVPGFAGTWRELPFKRAFVGLKLFMTDGVNSSIHGPKPALRFRQDLSDVLGGGNADQPLIAWATKKDDQIIGCVIHPEILLELSGEAKQKL